MNRENGSVGIDCCTEEWVKNTSLFRKREAMKQDIQRHKWCESQRLGYDIGWDRAAVDWMIRNETETLGGK